MPLTLNVGLSKKVGEPNYGSRGASVNVELELDSTLATQPDRMRERIREMFVLARSAVDEELRSAEGEPRHLVGANGEHDRSNGHGSNGHTGNGNGRNGNGRPATQSQVRAIHAISRRQRIDLAALLRERFGCDQPEDLSLRDASDLIDELNGSTSRNGGGRG